jgi:Glycosyl hydrolase family 20, catalytic domain
LDVTKELIATLMVPNRMNVLILEVNYGFRFQSHPELECRGLDKTQARDLTDFCRQHGVRLIPLFNCLGHQSWATQTANLLAKYPQFDETPHVPADNKGIYCREWCPSLPEVDKLVFDLLDELLEAFDAEALHVGMDEVFLIGDDKCPRCRGKDKGELLAGAINRLHQHLVSEKGVEMLTWGDRLLDAAAFPYGSWEASKTGSHRAVERIAKDIIICDWHYERRADYPSVRFFQQQGFRVLPAPWRNPEAAVALIRCAQKDATNKLLGVLFTGWSAGGNGEHLLAAWKAPPAPGSKQPAGEPQKTGQQIAATIRAGLKELDAAGQGKTPQP